MTDKDWYFVQILEPLSGQIRTICLYDEISLEEIIGLLSAAFVSDSCRVGSIQGLKDEETDIYYPISLLSRKGMYTLSRPLLNQAQLLRLQAIFCLQSCSAKGH